MGQGAGHQQGETGQLRPLHIERFDKLQSVGAAFASGDWQNSIELLMDLIYSTLEPVNSSVFWSFDDFVLKVVLEGFHVIRILRRSQQCLALVLGRLSGHKLCNSGAVLCQGIRKQSFGPDRSWK